MVELHTRQKKLMNVIVKVYDMLKLRIQNDSSESEFPTIESLEDLKSVDAALDDDSTKKKLVG